jgi:hypothetical protein
MKKLIANLMIAMVAIVGIPTLGLANANSATGSAGYNMGGSFANYRVDGHDTNRHQVYLNRGHVHISISGDGDTDLDLYVYDGWGNRVFAGESYSDDETACLSVNGAGYFTVKVFNRGHAYNIYRFTVEYK